MKIKNITLTVLIATLLWFASTSISDFTRDGYIRKQGHQVASSNNSEIVATAKRLLVSEAASAEELVDAAQEIIVQAENLGDVEMLLSGLSLYNRALEKDANSETALLGLADVSFKAGAFDKAYEFYHRYSELKPNDLRSKTNMALSLTQLGKSTEAIEILEEARLRSPHSFQVLLTLALSYKESGDLESAKKIATQAIDLAPDAQGRALLSSFLEEQQVVAETSVTEAAETPGKDYKKATEEFFNTHVILSPKVKEFLWQDKTVRVALENFPIDQMPPFARKSLEEKIQALVVQHGVVVVLIDAADQKELMRVASK